MRFDEVVNSCRNVSSCSRGRSGQAETRMCIEIPPVVLVYLTGDLSYFFCLLDASKVSPIAKLIARADSTYSLTLAHFFLPIEKT